ncbi:hypothetical protein [Snodgrassella sp. CS2]|uniref:hypothetical protein n=1 Tax=Snodgrassella sp. CS2 TaxID=3418953 RepID=UPI003CFFA240
MGSKMGLNLYKESSILINQCNNDCNNICKANLLERLKDNKFAVISIDYLYNDANFEKDCVSQKRNYYELVREEFSLSYLKWFNTEQEALENFFYDMD